MNGKNDLIKYRVDKAKEILKDAVLLLNEKRLSSSVNRLYYSFFYLINALLLLKDHSSSKHSGVKSLFNIHFVKTGKVDKEIGRFFSNLFDFRQKADYGDFVEFEEKKVQQWFENGKLYFDALSKLIEESER